MRKLAGHFGENPDIWGLSGLLHDIDYEITGEDSAQHGEVGAKLLEEKGICPEILNAIRKHNAEGLGLEGQHHTYTGMRLPAQEASRPDCGHGSSYIRTKKLQVFRPNPLPSG
ncbi:MAG: HDIG domain-containing protein [Desulfobacterales bacterium]